MKALIEVGIVIVLIILACGLMDQPVRRAARDDDVCPDCKKRKARQ